jgi:hypothetical protein
MVLSAACKVSEMPRVAGIVVARLVDCERAIGDGVSLQTKPFKRSSQFRKPEQNGQHRRPSLHLRDRAERSS